MFFFSIKSFKLLYIYIFKKSVVGFDNFKFSKSWNMSLVSNGASFNLLGTSRFIFCTY